MNLKNLIILFILTFTSVIAQPKITEVINLTENIEGKFFYPKFVENNSSIVFSTSNYQGLYKLEVSSGKMEILSEENGSGYNPLFYESTNDIFYKTYLVEKGKKISSVKSYNLKSKISKTIIENKRGLKIPNQISSSNLVIIESSVVKNEKINEANLSKENNLSKAVYVEDNNLYLIENNERKVLNPLGKGVYVWETLSKDGEKIIFSFGNRGAFICNLDGKILHEIPEAHYPRLSPDGDYLLYMKDDDDGYKYTASDIYIYSLSDEKSFALTGTDNQIEMFAEWSNDGKSIVYSTTEGGIILAKLKFEN